MSDRGKALLLYGQPKRMERTGGMDAPEIGNNSDATDAIAEIPTVTWVYEDAKTKEIFGVSRAGLRFSDRFNRNEFKFDRSGFDLNAAHTRAVAKAITQPGLTAAPAAAAAAAAPAPAAAAAAPTVPAAPAAVTDLTTDALKSAVAELKAAAKNPYENKAYATWGEYVTSTGTTFVPVGLYVPQVRGHQRRHVTFFGVVEDRRATTCSPSSSPQSSRLRRTTSSSTDS